MKKNDWILIVAVLVIAIGFLSWRFFSGHTENAEVEVTVDGKKYGTYPLQSDRSRKISINGSNTLIIENGKAKMEDADCPDKLCVHQKAISANGESIICLPNKVVVTVRSKAESEYDAVTN